MSREEEAKNLRLFDNRTVERNIRKGLVTRKDYEKFLKTLPDAADKAAPPTPPSSTTTTTTTSSTTTRSERRGSRRPCARPSLPSGLRPVETGGPPA
jgi:hypothetical protein